jgi:hypothetical protein
MRVKNDTTHEAFKRHLAASGPGVQFVAEWLRSLGLEVVVSESTTAPTWRDWKKHQDKGDLYVGALKPDHRVEVKHRVGYNFDGPDDFFSDTVFLCSIHKFDTVQPRPFAFIVLSGDCHSAGIAWVKETRHLWTVKRDVHDYRYGPDYTEDVYQINKGHLEWHQF